jgi:hypothetical protein
VGYSNLDLGFIGYTCNSFGTDFQTVGNKPTFHQIRTEACSLLQGRADRGRAGALLLVISTDTQLSLLTAVDTFPSV